ncbi:MAG TPA: pilus assembly protein TadG-related protein [Allosphingosinicella sp.]|nr:pilus assembly protein TadG-related protein [Allosphingosinicella sp.]
MTSKAAAFIPSLVAMARRLAGDSRGNALILGAATLPLMVGAAGIGVDTLSMSLAQRHLQRTADSAALAGGHALVQNNSVTTSVNHDLALNQKVTLSKTTVENAPSSGPFAGNADAVRVTVESPRRTPFYSFFTKTTPTMRAQATAAVVFTGNFCMVSLEEGNTTGITFTGNTTLDLGCGVATNAKAATAVSGSGSAVVNANPIAAVGGVPASTAYPSGTKLLPFSPKQPDPFSKLPKPQVPTTCNSQLIVPKSGGTVEENSSGIYCFQGMDIKGPVTLPKGTYYIDGGKVDLGPHGHLSGSEVTIILTSKTADTNPSSVAQLSLHGSAQMNLTSPTSGTYKGVLFYQDPRAPLNNSVVINGNTSTSFEGGFYFPRANMTFNGNTGMRTECMQLVALRLVFSGNSKVTNTCPATAGGKSFDAVFVRLVA